MTLFVASINGVASGTSKKTILQVAANSARQIKVVEFTVSFDGITASAVPVLCKLVRQTGAGTSTGVTPQELQPDATTGCLATAVHTCTVEPTSDDSTVEQFYLTPNGGLLTKPVEIWVPVSGRLGITVTAGATVNVAAQLIFDE